MFFRPIAVYAEAIGEAPIAAREARALPGTLRSIRGKAPGRTHRSALFQKGFERVLLLPLDARKAGQLHGFDLPRILGTQPIPSLSF